MSDTKYPACKGTNCGCTDGVSHSPECIAEHNKCCEEYPPRGQFSTDGIIYTHDDGSVHRRVVRSNPDECAGVLCSLYHIVGDCPDYINNEPCQYELINGAYVPTELEVLKADSCEAMRFIVGVCNENNYSECGDCRSFINRTCTARKWLERCGEKNAWEV